MSADAIRAAQLLAGLARFNAEAEGEKTPAPSKPRPHAGEFHRHFSDQRPDTHNPAKLASGNSGLDLFSVGPLANKLVVRLFAVAPHI
jgi:uncharacterized short protein YbdD (DUF466 family)